MQNQDRLVRHSLTDKNWNLATGANHRRCLDSTFVHDKQQTSLRTCGEEIVVKMEARLDIAKEGLG